jgi:hypothetical protein
MAECFARSQQAYTNGDRALAKDLSNEGKAHKQKMEDLNKRASDWIFRGEFPFRFGDIQRLGS